MHPGQGTGEVAVGCGPEPRVLVLSQRVAVQECCLLLPGADLGQRG